MKILLVDDEQQVLRGLVRMLESEIEDGEFVTADSGVAALEQLAEQEFQVIVSDMRMPGMNGAELLEKVAEQYPRVLRIVLSGQANREAVLSAVRPMHQYLSKPCNPDDLIEIIQRAEVFQETIRSAEVLDAIGRNNCLPSFPENLTRLNRVLERPESTSRNIADVISRDPALSAKVLQLANSAIFGLPNPVVDLAHGVSVVGQDLIRAIAVTQSVFSHAPQRDVLSSDQLFEHGLEVARLTRELSEINDLDREHRCMAFSGALLHDVGKILLVNAFPDRYRNLLQQTRDPRETWERELEEFGASHQGIGGYLLDRWGLPGDVVRMVATHHSLEICAHSDCSTKIVFAANWIANGADEGILRRRIALTDEPGAVEPFLEQLLEWSQRVNPAEELCNHE